MITVSYQYHRLKSSEVCCYVDGLLTLNAEVTLPSHDEVFIIIYYITILMCEK